MPTVSSSSRSACFEMQRALLEVHVPEEADHAAAEPRVHGGDLGAVAEAVVDGQRAFEKGDAPPLRLTAGVDDVAQPLQELRLLRLVAIRLLPSGRTGLRV